MRSCFIVFVLFLVTNTSSAALLPDSFGYLPSTSILN